MAEHESGGTGTLRPRFSVWPPEPAAARHGRLQPSRACPGSPAGGVLGDELRSPFSRLPPRLFPSPPSPLLLPLAAARGPALSRFLLTPPLAFCVSPSGGSRFFFPPCFVLSHPFPTQGGKTFLITFLSGTAYPAQAASCVRAGRADPCLPPARFSLPRSPRMPLSRVCVCVFYS